MREYKFRAWDKTREEMINVDMLLITESGMKQYRVARPLINGCLDVEFVQEDTILMQYTGLKDKNGVEIYEGDILVAKNKKDSKKNDWIGIIEDNNYGWLALKYKEYVNPSWFGALSEPVNDPQNASWIINNCEVIGNIYENPELLN